MKKTFYFLAILGMVGSIQTAEKSTFLERFNAWKIHYGKWKKGINYESPLFLWDKEELRTKLKLILLKFSEELKIYNDISLAVIGDEINYYQDKINTDFTNSEHKTRKIHLDGIQWNRF